MIKLEDAIFTGLMVILAFFYMKVTDIQLSNLDKHLTDIEFRIHILEMKLSDKHRLRK